MPAAGPRVSRIWPVTSSAKVQAMIRTASGPRSATSREAWANRKSPVRIATVLSQRALALTAPHGGLVHHIVVIERRQVDELDDGGSAHHLSRPSLIRPELAGQQGEQRPEPFTPGVDEVQRRLGEKPELALQL